MLYALMMIINATFIPEMSAVHHFICAERRFFDVASGKSPASSARVTGEISSKEAKYSIPATVNLANKANMLPLAIYLLGAFVALIGGASVLNKKNYAQARRGIAVAAAGFGLQIVGVAVFGYIALQ